jgi:hypothetical protein
LVRHQTGCSSSTLAPRDRRWLRARPCGGRRADKATAAALAIYPGSHANSVERDSENGATWEVEVAKPDGSTVDARLDQSYKLVVAEADSGDQGGN